MDSIKAFNGDKYLGEEFLKLIKKFKIKNIIETGTYRRDTTRAFSGMADKVYTIESNRSFYFGSKKILKNYSNVRTFFGSSPEVLKKILPNIKENTLFFLDAHWGHYWPILDELKEISKIDSLKNSVIVIHDFYVPEVDFGYDSYYHSDSKFELFLKKFIGFFGRKLNMNLVEKQKLDYDFIKEKLKKINPEFKHYYNSRAEGAKRGVIFIHP